jgi:hypothetical protein
MFALLYGYGVWVTITLSNFDVQKWHHYCVVLSTNAQYIYIDGNLAQSGSLSTITPTSTQPFQIGRTSHPTNRYYWAGYIDEIIVETKEWTAADVKKYYTYSKGRFGIQ